MGDFDVLTHASGLSTASATSGRLSLEGRNEELPVHFRLPYGDVRSFRLARANSDRLASRPTLILDLAGGGSMRISSLAQPGIVAEVTDRLSLLRPQSADEACG